MEQASACYSGMAPWVTTLATLVGISHSSAIRCMQKPKTRQQGKAKTHKQTIWNHKVPRSNHAGS